MPQSKTQLLPEMPLSELIERFGTEPRCEAAPERARWPSGLTCPACGESADCTFLADGRRDWQCGHCRAQTTDCSGTLFHAPQLSLTRWFQAIYPVIQNKNNISMLRLKRYLGVCHRTARRVKHKLLDAMAEREEQRLLSGVVVADDVSLGGIHAGEPGRGSENKVPFMAAVEPNREGHPVPMRFDPIADPKGSTMANRARSALHAAVHLVIDGWASFATACAVAGEHGAITLSPRQSSDPAVFQWVNTFISNLKTAVRGTDHHFELQKYAARYVAEAQYRVNRRFEVRSLVDRLLWSCTRTEPCPETWLRLGLVRSS